MSLTAVTLVMLSATIHVVWNVLTKSSVSPKAFSLVKGTFLIIISLCALPAFPLRSIPMDVWIYVGLSGVIHGVYIWALSTAYETGDISFVYPVARSAPAFVPSLPSSSSGREYPCGVHSGSRSSSSVYF